MAIFSRKDKKMEKVRVGVIGATGMVGQKYVRLLDDHPWFEVKYVAASPKSAGKTYGEAVAGRWVMDGDVPEGVKNLVVHDASRVTDAKEQCGFGMAGWCFTFLLFGWRGGALHFYFLRTSSIDELRK
jgi:hypothetical protein